MSRSAWIQFHAYHELGASLDRKKDPAGAGLLKRAEGLLDSLWDRLGSDELKMTFLTNRENVYTNLVRSDLVRITVLTPAWSYPAVELGLAKPQASF
jgi:hypothetical protein